jgi:hypothetical protein
MYALFLKSAETQDLDTLSPDQAVGAFKLLAHSWRFHGRFDLVKGSRPAAPKREQEVRASEGH